MRNLILWQGPWLLKAFGFLIVCPLLLIFVAWHLFDYMDWTEAGILWVCWLVLFVVTP